MIEVIGFTCHIEQGLRDAIGTHVSNTTKDDHIHDDSQNWLYQIPQRSEDCLFVLYDDVSFHKKGYQVTVGPYLLEVDFPQLLLWPDNHCPFFFHIFSFLPIVNC